MKNEELLKLGQKIRFERTKRNLSQDDLEELSGVSRRTISDLERGITDIRYTNLLQLANALKLELHKLLDFKL